MFCPRVGSSDTTSIYVSAHRQTPTHRRRNKERDRHMHAYRTKGKPKAAFFLQHTTENRKPGGMKRRQNENGETARTTHSDKYE